MSAVSWSSRSRPTSGTTLAGRFVACAGLVCWALHVQAQVLRSGHTVANAGDTASLRPATGPGRDATAVLWRACRV
jgi:hypothetical protein